MKTYKNRNQKVNSECTTVLFVKTNKIMDSKYWVECNESEIKGQYLGSDSYNGTITESWGIL